MMYMITEKVRYRQELNTEFCMAMNDAKDNFGDDDGFRKHYMDGMDQKSMQLYAP